MDIQGLEQLWLSGPGSCQVKVQLLFRGGGGLLLNETGTARGITWHGDPMYGGKNL